MALSKHNEKHCLQLDVSSIGSKKGIIEGDVIDNEAKAILGKCPEAKFMVDEIEKHLLDRYASVFNGNLNNVESFPLLYDYGVDTKKGSKAFAMQYAREEEIKNRIKILQGAKKTEDVRERSHLEEILIEKRPQACEDRVNQRFLTFFKNEPGLFLHGFKPKEYLQRFRELAKQERKTMSTLKLLDIELCVLELLGIKEQEIEDWVNDKIDRIRIKSTQENGMNSRNIVPGALIWDVLQLDSSNSFSTDRKNQYNQFKSLFSKFKTTTTNGKQKDMEDENGYKIEKMYTLNEIRARLLESEFDFRTNFDDEYDLFFFHLNEKLILAGEVKQAMNTDKKANDKQAKSASHQLRKSEKFMQKTFGPLLDQGWRFVKIAILYDNHGTYVTDRCSGCGPFILTNGTEQEEKRQMQQMWKKITGKEYIGPPKVSNASGMRDFQHLFARLIGFSGLSFIVQKIGNYHELMGTNPHDIFDEGITAGWTCASPLTFGNEQTDIRFGDVVGRPSDIYRLIFWNPDQRDLLTGNHRFVIFCSDYGAGKSLLLKEGSIREAQAIDSKLKKSESIQEQQDVVKAPTDKEFFDVNKPNAFFICLVATDDYGKPAKEHYLYDVATEMELQGFRVKFLSAKDIKDFYLRHHPEYDNTMQDTDVEIYEMTHFFIAINKGSSFFLDEVRFILGEELSRSKHVYSYTQMNWINVDMFLNIIIIIDISIIYGEWRNIFQFKVYYEASSVQKLEKFILDCQKEIVEGKLWIAMQANHLSDRCLVGSSFELSFKEMLSNLERSFTLPNLTRNMRNSKAIIKASQDVTFSGPPYKTGQMIQKLPPPTTFRSQDEPIVIPVHRKYFEGKFRNILDETFFDTKKKTLILHSRKFKGQYIQSLLLKNFPDIEAKTIVDHDDHPCNATKNELQEFLKEPKIKIGIFQDKFMTGMENSNVICFHDNDNDSVRSKMTRAVSQLCIVLLFEDGNSLPMFKRTKVNRNFLKCLRLINEHEKSESIERCKLTPKEYFACLSCNTKPICPPCLIGCHQEHEVKLEQVAPKDAENMMTCHCYKSNCFIQLRNF